MDFVVTPGSRIDKLPKAARIPALLLRNARDRAKRLSNVVIMKPLYGFVFNSDGLATAHYSPFLDDRRFNEAYQQVAASWLHGRSIDIRWRMWFLTQCAAQCRFLPGSFVEFGVYRGGCAFMILTVAGLAENQCFYLFDTFRGVPETNLSKAEKQAGFAGRLADTSLAHVKKALRPWITTTVLVEGDIFDTLQETETGPVAFCHLDLNASAPTKRALEYLYPRLVPSGMIVMDDYGYRGYEEQRGIIEAFFADKPEQTIALPTGQGLVVKL
jgi:O-methyltransferase